MQRTAAGGVVVLATTAILALPFFKEWSATIRPQDGSTVTGTATVQTRDGDTLLVNISIRGAKTGELLPWHVHSGGCDNSGGVLGDASQYRPIRVGSGESSTEMARVKTVLTVGVPYSVNVHRSTSDTGVIACGNLRPIAGR